jgi:hypothetical protein
VFGRKTTVPMGLPRAAPFEGGATVGTGAVSGPIGNGGTKNVFCTNAKVNGRSRGITLETPRTGE